MARRAGKAASRRSRQRKAQQRQTRPSAAAPPNADGTAPLAAPVGTPVTPPEVRDEPAVEVQRRVAPSARPTIGSNLTVGERAEYHYVERDLRNIGVLTLIMLALLIAAYFAFNAVGLTG